MAGDILIIKKRGQKISLKITQKRRAGVVLDHKIVINLWDFRDVALMFHDFKDLYGVPVDKAIVEYQKGRSKVWPF